MIRAAICIVLLLSVAAGVAQDEPAGIAAPQSSGDAVAGAGKAAGREAAFAFEPMATAEVKSFKFRRVFLPEKELHERTQRPERYVPMDSAEFDARLRRLESGERGAGEQKTGIAYGSYSARLDHRFQLSGTGAWRIKLVGKEPALVPLTGLEVALRDFRWQAAVGSTVSAAPAKLGATENDGPALYVEQSGTLEFDWSLAGSQDREGGWFYKLAFPPSAAHRIELTLPANLRPVIDGAIISPGQSAAAAERHWTIDLAGRSRATLRLLKSDAQEHPKPLALFRPRLTYELSVQGLQLSADLRLDVFDEPIRRMELDVNPELTLLSVKAGDETVSWSESNGSRDDGANRIVLEFAEPLRGMNRQVRLIAVAPLKSRGAWKLPNVRARDVVWQDGSMALVVAAPVSLERLDLIDCRQNQRQTLPPPATGEVLGIQALTPAAAITVHVAPRQERLELTSGTTIELEADEAVASYVTEIAARQGERWQLSAEISADWIIDSVQSSPVDMITDWNRERDQAATTRLVIQLARAITRERPLRLIVRATRRRAPLGDTLSMEDLRLLKFDNIEPVRRLALVQAAAPHRLELRGAAELSRLVAAQLDAADRSLVGDARQGLLFLDDEFAGDLQISLAPERPRWSARMQTRVIVADENLDEMSELRIDPVLNPLERLLVHFTQARTGELAWTVDDGSASELSLRRLKDEEQKTLGVGSSGETWEVKLRPARTLPFVLRTKRTSRLSADMPVSLPSLPEATSQQGNVIIELTSEFAPQLVERGLKALAIEPPLPGHYQNVLAAYEYDPTEDLLVAKEPALRLKIDRQTAHRRPAWVWRSKLDAWFSTSRHTQYRARLMVENRGRSRMSMNLPVNDQSPAVPPLVKIDGEAANRATWDEQTRELQVPLPDGRRFCLVDVSWDGSESRLGGVSRRRLRWPEVDVPVLQRDATIWLPSGYVLSDNANAPAAAPAKKITWRQRLFGPLGRPSDGDTFEPWWAADWARRMGNANGDGNALRLAERFADQALSTPSTAVTSSQQPGSMPPSDDTWGDQLYRTWSQTTGKDALPSAPLLIHLESLAAADIRPSLAIRSNPLPSSDAATIGALLEQHGLVLLAFRQAVVLSAREWAATNCDARIATARQVVFSVGSADLSSLPFHSPGDAALQMTPLERWLELSDSESSLWPAADGSASNLPREGWIAYPLEGSANDADVRLLIVRRQTLTAFCAGTFLVSAGVFWRLWRRPAFLQIGGLAVVVIIALLLPAVFAPLGAAAVLGFLGGQCCRWLFPTTTTARSVEPAAEPVATTASVLFVVAFLWATSANAQVPTKAETKNAPQGIYDVLIPIDDDQQVVGDKVYVPEALYQELMARTSEHRKEVRYLITSARYDALNKAMSRAEAPAVARDWKASLTVEVLQSPARVLLPLGAQIVPDSGQLNGQPLRFGWDEARKSYYFDVKEEGAAKVEFEFRPAPAEAASSVSFAIPAIPQSTLRLTVADFDHPPRVEALGATRADAATKQLIAEMGPIERVSATWSGLRSGSEPSPQFDSEELVWLKLRPGSVTLNARFTVQVRRGAVAELPLLLDERLLPLPLASDSPLESIVRVSENEVRLRFASPLTDRAVVELAFVVQEASGLGSFAWPQLQLVGADVSRRYIACTVDQSLELISSPAAGMKLLDPAKFAIMWGDAEARPMAFDAGLAPPRWQIDVRPRQAKLTSSHRSTLELSATFARLQWNAAIDIANGSRFQLRSAIPVELEVDQVEIRDSSGIRASHWIVSNGRLLTVFLDAAAAGRLELTLRGQLPVRQDRPLSVPLLQVEGCAENKSTLFVMRRSGVLASVEQREALRDIPDTEVAAFLSASADAFNKQSKGQRSHLVAAVEAPSSRGPITIAMQKNQPTLKAVQAMSLSRQGDVWQAALDVKLNVSEGFLDVVRIEAPASWTGPFRVEPEMPLEVIEAPGESGSQLLLMPARPISGEARLRIEGRVSTPTGQRVRAPDARVAGAAQLQQYFALPQQQELQSLAWETRGLKPEAIPQELLQPAAGGQTFQTFLKVADEMRAELRSVEKIADDVQIRLADFAVSWMSDEACFGTAVFDIEPAGRKSCRLALPAGYQLVHLCVDGRPLQLVPAGDLRWQVPLSGGRLPQRIELVFMGQLSTSAASKQFDAPKLIGLPVERTLWTVSGPRSAGAAIGSNLDQAPPVHLEATRYESIAGIIESATATLSELAMDETPRWYAAWSRRMMAAREVLTRLQILATEANLESAAKVELVDQDQERLAERLGTYDLLAMMWENPPAADTAIAAWNASHGRTHGEWQATFLGESSSLELSYANPVAGNLTTRITQALLAATLLLLAALATRYSRSMEWLRNRPRAIGVAIGICWWLFLWPSAVGWLIVAASIAVPVLKLLARPRRRWLPAARHS